MILLLGFIKLEKPFTTVEELSENSLEYHSVLKILRLHLKEKKY